MRGGGGKSLLWQLTDVRTWRRTLAVSRGKVTMSAQQAARPALMNLTPKEGGCMMTLPSPLELDEEKATGTGRGSWAAVPALLAMVRCDADAWDDEDEDGDMFSLTSSEY